MRFFNLAAFVIFTLFCIIVAVANRAEVTFSLHPLPFAWEFPLYAILFIGLFIGFAAGAIVVIQKSIRHGQVKRRQAKEIRELEKRLRESEPKEPDPSQGEDGV